MKMTKTHRKAQEGRFHHRDLTGHVMFTQGLL
jgi:hypothetical protein